MDALQWFNKGSFINVMNRKLFIYDSDSTNSKNKPVLLILHGYPTCSYDYFKALPYLETKFRIILHDHLGFGYSDKPIDYSYSLLEQAEFALNLWEKLKIKRGHLLAHDYGTSVATEIIALNEEKKISNLDIKSVTLCNGSIHIELAKLRFIQKLLLNKITGPIVARLSNKNILSRNLRNIYFDKHKISDFEIDALWTMMNHNHGKKILHKTTQYIKQRYIFWERWIGALKSTELPIHIIWAQNDPVAVIEIAELLKQECKNSELVILKRLGHFPMLENPKIWSNAIIKSIKSRKYD